MPAPVIRCLLVDDSPTFRATLKALLAAAPGVQVVGEAGNGQDAMAEAERLRPDVVLMDLVMPGMDGIEAIRRIVAQQPTARILVLTSFATDDKVFPAIKAGAMGYLLKDCGAEELVQAIRQVHQGQSSLHPKIARMVLQEVAEGHFTRDGGRKPARPEYLPTVEPLTERELDVLKQVASGRSNQEIAHALAIAEGTVRTHVSNILSKLHLASRTQATLFALREGLASLDDAALDVSSGEEPTDL